MQIYFADLQAIERHTMQLDGEYCPHCRQARQLISHGYIHKKRVQAAPERVGKRVFCSNRNQHTGCGRTLQLYLAATIRHLHHGASQVGAFILALITGSGIGHAYRVATGTDTPRHAYRWLARIFPQLSHYRSLHHRPALPADAAPCAGRAAVRHSCLVSTFPSNCDCASSTPCTTRPATAMNPRLVNFRDELAPVPPVGHECFFHGPPPTPSNALPDRPAGSL